MVASCLAAYLFPFELFLLAYATLGPLHYLTEISWLHDRRYFVGHDSSPAERRRLWVWLALVGITLAVMIVGLAREQLLHQPASAAWEIGLFYLVFVAAALFVFRSRPLIAGGAILFTGLGAWAFGSSPYYGLVAFLIITIVHVLLFTAAFVALGALRTRSRSGFVSLGVLAACAISFFLFAPPLGAQVGTFVHQAYAPFETLNVQLIRLFGLGPGNELREIYESRAGAIVIRLIAFAYTYHYLNWFTKTSVIGWNKMSRARAAAILLLWLAAVSLYAQSFVLGFTVLYALSVLHVMLELPLNHQSFAGIGRALLRAAPHAAAPAAAPVRVSRKAARRARRFRAAIARPRAQRG